MELILIFCLGCVSLYFGVKQHRREKVEDTFYLTELPDKTVLLNIADTTRKAQFNRIKI